MRRILGSAASLLTGVALTTLSAAASAGIIQDENAKPGISGSWTANDGTARFDGAVDVYPAQWSIARGDAIKLKVRSTTGYDVRVMRLGWYGGRGAAEVKLVTGQAASPQPYPTSEPQWGLTEAKWADSVTIPTDASWTPGLYVARVEQSGGKSALTFFTMRDDGLAAKLPILFVIGTATHQSYNAWPGPEKGGKSLYGFNSSPTHPTDAIRDLAQSVKVSFDRPFFVGGGTADLAGYEYPMVRWLEKYGYDVAYATDVDLHANPDLAKGRRAVVFSGHEEYVSWEMFDNAIAARDSGTNFLFLSGDTWSWQVRFEAGPAGPYSTMVGYKENWVKDPEQKEAFKLREAGDIEGAKTHFRKVTRGWKNLEFDAARGIDLRRPGMTLTGVQSSGIMRDAAGNGLHGGLYPWGDLFIDAPSFWLFEGTGLKGGDKIPNVMGYEVDSTMKGSTEFDAFRPAGQTKLGTIKQVSDGTPKGAVGFYQKDVEGGKRVEVLAMGAIYFAWALDDWAAKSGGFENTMSPAADKMMNNVMKRWTGADPIPPVTAPPEQGGNDPGTGYDPESDAGINPANPGGTPNGAAPAASESSGGCSIGTVGPATDRLAGAIAVFGVGLFVASLTRRAQRRRDSIA